MKVNTSEKAFTDVEIAKEKLLTAIKSNIRQWKRMRARCSIRDSDHIGGILKGLEIAKTIIKTN